MPREVVQTPGEGLASSRLARGLPGGSAMSFGLRTAGCLHANKPVLPAT